MRHSLRHALAAVAALAAAAVACAHAPRPPYHGRPTGAGGAVHVRVHETGPPPHAPAHGHRRKHESGVELVFDRSLDVYLVVGHADYYWDGARFLRWTGFAWEVSADLGGVWVRVGSGEVPKRLAVTKTRRPGKGRGHPAKRAP